jgi:N-acetylglucosamine-6-phosphate deacetylase
MILIKNGSVLTPNGLLDRACILVRDTIIEAVGIDQEFQQSGECQIVNSKGLLVVPGFIDLQVNGGFGHDFTIDPASIWQVASDLPRFGVTTFLPTIISSPKTTINQIIKIFNSYHKTSHVSAVPIGLHIEGPFISHSKKGAHNPEFIRSIIPSELQSWSPDNGVLLVTMAPEIPGALSMIKILASRGVVVSAGHSNATYEQSILGIEAGITCGTHIFNAMSSLSHREPGLPGALLSRDDVYIGIIADGLHVHPALISIMLKVKGGSSLILVSDAMSALGMPPGVYSQIGEKVYVDKSSARLSDGTLAGSILGLDQALRNLISYTNCSLEDAILTITSTPAKLLQLDRKGSIIVGYDADLTFLTPSMDVAATMIAGKFVYINKNLFSSS